MRQNLVDVRSPDEYAGRLMAPAHLPQEQAQRAGHIPTAANVPWSKAANDDGTFKSDDELKELYTEAGVDWGKDTIAYCRIGERSSHTWFVLKELLGQQNVKNYDGSWTEYGSLVGVPVALGDERRGGGRLMCGAKQGGLSLDGVDVAKEAVVQGQVAARRRARAERLRPPARPHRRVHRRGARPRRPATSGSSPTPVAGPCAPSRLGPRSSTRPWTPRSVGSPRSPSPSDPPERRVVI